ncbi:hypothetical protein NC651_024842 [Populus alba x Populus x berolinensis]|nr:hypothetical protein NC651_024842 [Populus alba x Populus x berolinensis]
MRAREKGLSKVEERHKFLQEYYEQSHHVLHYKPGRKPSRWILCWLSKGDFPFKITQSSTHQKPLEVHASDGALLAMWVYVFLQVNYWRKKSTSLSKVFIEEKYAVADISFIVLYVVVSDTELGISSIKRRSEKSRLLAQNDGVPRVGIETLKALDLP